MRNRILIFAVTFICSFTTPAWSAPDAKSDSIQLFRYTQKKRASLAQGVIVVSDRPTGVALEAAAVLQDGFLQMTGTKISIRTVSEFRRSYGNSSDIVPIMVGPSELAKREGIDIPQKLELADRYIIRCNPAERYIALQGNDAEPLRGTIYAVYDFLERLGCGWFGPDSLWQVYPKVGELWIPPVDDDESPAFASRSIWLVSHLPCLADAWRLGGMPISHGHALDEVVPREKHEQQHPEYFGSIQPCLSHPEVIRIAADYCRQQIQDQKDRKQVSISLCAIDRGGYCECDRCKAVGNIGARMLYFANGVAKELSKSRRGRYLLTIYAYWHTHDPPNPPIKAEPGVIVMQVNEGDHLRPWDTWQSESEDLTNNHGKSNRREMQAFGAWKATGATMAIYEWWIPGCTFQEWRNVPWHPGETTLRNLRYWKSQGVQYISCESQPKLENGNGFPIRWPVFYVGAKGLWNPSVTSPQVMAEACRKLYGPAHEPMFEYYQLLEKAALDCPAYGWSWNLPPPELVYPPEIREPADKLLTLAKTLTKDQQQLARIQQEKTAWDLATDVMVSLSRSGRRMYTVLVDGRDMQWHRPQMQVWRARKWFGVPEDRPIQEVLPNGEKQALPDTHVLDLTSKPNLTIGE